MAGVVVVPGGWFAAPYFADPASVPEPWLHVVAWVAAVITFMATAVLTVLGYMFMFPRDVRAARSFATIVGEFAAIGAILGTLLGLRMAAPLLAEEHNTTFVEFIGIVGNTATILTLTSIALCWIPSVGAVSTSVRANIGSTPLQRLLFAVILLAGSNVGFYAARAVWTMLVNPGLQP